MVTKTFIISRLNSFSKKEIKIKDFKLYNIDNFNLIEYKLFKNEEEIDLLPIFNSTNTTDGILLYPESDKIYLKIKVELEEESNIITPLFRLGDKIENTLYSFFIQNEEDNIINDYIKYVELTRDKFESNMLLDVLNTSNNINTLPYELNRKLDLNNDPNFYIDTVNKKIGVNKNLSNVSFSTIYPLFLLDGIKKINSYIEFEFTNYEDNLGDDELFGVYFFVCRKTNLFYYANNSYTSWVYIGNNEDVITTYTASKGTYGKYGDVESPHEYRTSNLQINKNFRIGIRFVFQSDYPKLEIYFIDKKDNKNKHSLHFYIQDNINDPIVLGFYFNINLNYNQALKFFYTKDDIIYDYYKDKKLGLDIINNDKNLVFPHINNKIIRLPKQDKDTKVIKHKNIIPEKIYYGGNGYIKSYLKIDLNTTKQPKFDIVYLFDILHKKIIDSTYSDPITGEFSFYWLATDRPFLLYSLDRDGNYTATASGIVYAKPIP